MSGCPCVGSLVASPQGRCSLLVSHRLQVHKPVTEGFLFLWRRGRAAALPPNRSDRRVWPPCHTRLNADNRRRLVACAGAMPLCTPSRGPGWHAEFKGPWLAH
eukprot:365451-Chlamydomonas_euryale.AAC.7